MHSAFKTLTLASALALVATAAVTGSHGNANPAVKARQAHMSLLSFNAGQLFAMAKGTAEYDAETAGKLSADLVALSGMLSGPAMSLYFPEGTAAGEVENTRSMPEIWLAMDDFEVKANALTTASEALAAVAATDLASMQGAIGPLGAACGACHDAYRTPNN